MANSIQVIPKGDFNQIVCKKPFSEELFSRRELRIMDDLVFIFKDTIAEDMIESTHLRHTPWDKTFREKGQYSLIDYMLILDDQPDSVSYEDAMEEITDREEMIQAFGGR